MKIIDKIGKELKKYKFDYLLLSVFLLATALIRFTPIVTGNFPFLFDHGRDLLDVKKIVVDHHMTLIGPFTGIQGVFQGPYHYYLLAIAFIIGNAHPAAGTFFMAILGVIGVLLCYILGKKILGRTFGILAALIFAVAPSSIAFSQHFWNPHWIPFLMVTFYFALYKSIFDNKKYLVLSWFLAGCMAQFEIADGLWMFPVLILSYILLDRKAFLSRWFYVGLLTYGILFIPQAFFDFRHQFLMTKSIIGLFQGKNLSLGEIIPFAARPSLRLSQLLNATAYSFSYNQILGNVFLAVGFLYTVYVCLTKQIKQLKVIVLFLTAPVVYYIIFVLFPRPAWSWYWIGLQVSYYFFIAYVFSQLLKFNPIIKYGAILLLGVWAVVTVWGYHTFPVYDDQGTGIFKNEMRVINYIYKDADGKPFSEFVYTPPVYDYAYQYLFWWAGTRIYHYVPRKNKTGVFYLIIEPDTQRPAAPNGWKETVIKTGKVQWDKVFPGNITLEKRIGE